MTEPSGKPAKPTEPSDPEVEAGEPTEPEPSEPVEPSEPEPAEPQPSEPEPAPSEPEPAEPEPPTPPAPPSPPTRPMPLPAPDPVPPAPPSHPDPTYPAPPPPPSTPPPSIPPPSTPRHPDPTRRPEPLTEAELREAADAPEPLDPPDEVATNPVQPALRREHAHRAEHRAERRPDRGAAASKPAGPKPPPPTDDPSTTSVPADGRRRLVEALGLRATRGRLLAGGLCALLGFALVVQARQTQSEGLSSLRQDELVRILDDVTSNSERLSEDSRALQEQRDTLQSGTNRSEAAEKVARDRLDVLGILAGTIPATGSGIELDIADPDVQVGAAVLIDTVQELRDAGAEAMQVNGERIVASSFFVDDGNGVKISGAQLTPPYRFRVIGDSQTLGAALEIPGGVLEVLRQRGATGTVTPKTKLVVDAVVPVPQATYAEPAPASS